MKTRTSKNLMRLMIFVALGGAFYGAMGCAGKQMPPARVIPPGDDNTRLCKQTYLMCRSECATVKDKDTRLKCADQCERDVDSCLLQSHGTKEK